MGQDSDRAVPGDDPKRRKVLEAALEVFGRYGFRKTSMEEVARAAHLSRQALYLHFATKDALFLAALAYTLDDALGQAQAALGDAASPLEGRLVGAFNAWMGRYVGVLGVRSGDLEATATELGGSLVSDREARFVEAVLRAIRGAGLAAAYHLPGLSARQLTTTFYATAKGLTHLHQSREAFVEELTLAARLLCAPLRRA